MKPVFLLHLFYPDLAVALVEAVAALGRADIDLVATHVGPLDSEVEAALDRVPGVVHRMEVPNGGWDVGPLFAVLPWLEGQGYDPVLKLHTKQGSSGYAAEWRALAHAGTIGSEPLVDEILRAFAADPALALVGAGPLFKSSAEAQFANAELLAELAPAVAAPSFPPSDWGFFAGTMFWARTALLRRVADACAAAAIGPSNAAGDGEMAHAAERLFGLAPLALGGRIGLVEDGALRIADMPDEPSHEPIVRTLVNEAERAMGGMEEALAELVRVRNPLVDYIRHGRDADALDPNPYFSSGWYLKVNPDVAGAGVHPLAHYLEHGWKELRSTGPLFDGAFYLKTYDDVTGNPLGHFMSVGLAEGRRGLPVADPAERAGLKHFYRSFDLVAERRFLDAMAARPAETGLVSVVMPAFNRAGSIGAAIRSVLAQTHRELELIVIDDGSTDGTADAVLAFDDPRIRLIRGDHAGVSAARNAGLDQASGRWIAYLDSDNRWVPWHLEVMLRAMAADAAEIGTCAIALRDDLGQLTGYRGAPFDWDECLKRNWVDLNCLVHARALLGETGGFDPRLRRMVDWDLILRLTRGRTVAYAPFVGCDYHDGRADADRITMAEPAAFEQLVRTKNALGLEIGSPAFDRALRLSFAIKIAAPAADRAMWGDAHFADALAAAIERLGHRARVDCREEWTGHELADEDVAIVLRGLLPYPPRAGQIGFLWAISHPDQIGWDEYERFARVFAASPSHAALLEQVIDRPVEPLLQATDPERFRPTPQAEDAPALLFVGNSRNADRAIIRWAVEAGYRPTIFGGGWTGRVAHELVAADAIDNRALGPLYAGARAVLNDHWPSMRAFGIVSNRLFDVAAAGGRAISDAVPGISGLFGNAVIEVDGAPAFARAVRTLADTPEAKPARQARAAAAAEAHGFDRRARRLVDAALEELGLRPRPAAAPDRRLHVHVVARRGQQGWQSSAYIRLIAPLTDPTVADRIRITVGEGREAVPPCDVCIVQRTAFDATGQVDRLVARLGAIGAALVVDVDDAFRAIGDDHPEAPFYRPLVAALDRAVAAAAECWCSTQAVADGYAGIAGPRLVIPNALDARLWRDWRAPDRAPFDGERVRMLYMGTHTHRADLARLRPALDRLHGERPGRFDLTLVGIAGEVEPAPWLHRLAVPGDAIAYPRFVRWLRNQGPFDLGVAPLADDRFNAGKSDIKLLDYAALGLLPVVEAAEAYRADPRAAAVAVHAHHWYATLSGILDDPAGARDRARAAAAYVWRHRAIAGVAGTMLTRLDALTQGSIR